ncbi:phospholipase domain-containing protein [Actinopolymorpha rutila]|uniref:phospholipase domain-containing protein n=1 Tax=Actinopolymorpha rutila TaxID=446787 RepID=UPI00307DB4C7
MPNARTATRPTSSTSTLRLRALDHGDTDQTLRLAARDRRVVDWPTDDGWYDIEVQAVEDPTFRRRLVGRIEDGRAGRTA